MSSELPSPRDDNDPSVTARPAAAGPGATPGQGPARREVTVRRAPRFAPFMGLGVLVGVVIAAIVAYAGPGDPTLTRESIFGFFIMVFAIPGLLLGALLVLVLDQISVRRSKRAVAQRTYDDDQFPE
ncbi:hypothetical protein ACX80T_06020 [Arthrobacter sp. Sr33]